MGQACFGCALVLTRLYDIYLSIWLHIVQLEKALLEQRGLLR